MSVYVDYLWLHPRKPRPYYGGYCHLLADTEEELHEFALDRLGLARAFFQCGRLPHYDLTEKMRARAVAAGAIEITRRQVAEMLRTRPRMQFP